MNEVRDVVRQKELGGGLQEYETQQNGASAV